MVIKIVENEQLENELNNYLARMLIKLKLEIEQLQELALIAPILNSTNSFIKQFNTVKSIHDCIKHLLLLSSGSIARVYKVSDFILSENKVAIHKDKIISEKKIVENKELIKSIELSIKHLETLKQQLQDVICETKKIKNKKELN
jgi:hypothetical protein